MLSYHADMEINTNPYELGLDRLVDIDAEFDFIGKPALQKIRQTGVTRSHVGLIISGPAMEGSNTRFWPLEKDGQLVGKVTSEVCSPRLEKNIALEVVDANFSTLGTDFIVITPKGNASTKVVKKPFFDAKKKLAAS